MSDQTRDANTTRINRVAAAIAEREGVSEAMACLVTCTVSMGGLCFDLTAGQQMQMAKDVADVINAHVTASQGIRKASGQ